jgi:DNA-binding CsgD family transcriptional regulator
MELHDRFPALLERLYAAPGSTNGWHAFLLDLCITLDGTAANFLSHNLCAQQASIALTARTDPAAVQEYVTYWGGRDPWAYSGRWQRLAPGAVITGEQMVSRRKLRQTDFYNDFGRKYDITQCVAGLIETAPPNQASFLTIDAADSRAAFGDREVSLLRALMPHLLTALQVHRRLCGAGALVDVSQTMLNRLSHGVFIFNTAGRLMLANAAAENFLRQRDGLSLDRGELRTASGSDTATLRRLMASAVRTSKGTGTSAGGTLVLSRPSGRRPFRVVVASISVPRFVLGPEPPAAIVFVTDPERTPLPSEGEIRALFGLTKAEARLAKTLVDGLSLETAARQLGLRVGTLRTRLKSIFEKTGCHRQADLVRLILVSTVADVFYR